MEKNEIVKKIEAEAIRSAKDTGSIEVNIAHLLYAMFMEDTVMDAFEKVFVNKDFKNEAVGIIAKEIANAPRLSIETIERYKRAKIDRKVRLSQEVQVVMSCATKESQEVCCTGKVEVSHLVLAVIGAACFSSSINDILKLDGPDKMKMNACNVLNILVEEEAKQYGREPEKFILQDHAFDNLSQNEKRNDINEFCTNMITTVDQKPFIGRDKELDLLMQCLSRRDKPNAILTGAPGVGKTDIVRGLAKKIANNDVPDALKNVNLFMVDIPAMVAGSELRGAFEKKLKETIELACKANRPILFLDEIHVVLGAGKTMDSSMDAANILKPYLTEGKIRVIGATTEDEFRKHVEKDAAFMRRFQKIDVAEPTVEDAIEIINGIKPTYENFHSMKVNGDAVKAAVNLSVKHIHDRYLPDKAIDIIDQTCARVRLNNGKKVTVSEIEATVAELCHVPVQNVQKDELEKIRKLDKKLKAQVFGQDEAIDTITEAIQLSKAGLNDESKPIGSFLFVGPSGVGKTEISKQLASNLGIDFIRFDMSEYMEAHSVAKLIGAPAGYVGYDDGGILVEKVRQCPHCVLLFDEIEKAHPDIYKIFLQMLDYGIVTDSKGRKADFRNTVIIMTSNAGNRSAEKKNIGFGDVQINSRKADTMNAVSNLMAPELRGRLSATVVFNQIDDKMAKMIVKKELKLLSAKLKAKGIVATYTDAAINKIANAGISDQYGAREIQKLISNDIKKMFVKQIISGNGSGNYLIDVKNGNFILTENEQALCHA